ncbi:FUSC family protein [Micromonospora mirobrigensis]|uniref:Uncharacterized membrane protein YgaE, UPF0421/DUF939 family n=1 Tax=Micromonospora mirobrigensis TaxID=262898 RepID=A0A1C4W913_9ACTN|nr:FUSC family protein [Micromonospora mirobrigensis]SCE92726.1 Uncharacterized membrane protein YgaE, UPF0421/DUF939 family [Micromonospora mirobrigensis]
MTEERRDPDPARSPLGAVAGRGREAVTRARREGEQAGRLRLRQLEITVVIAVQAGLAAALAALVANRLLGPGAHVFAPAAAVGTIAAAIGQRARRTVELLAGVGLGITVGDVLRYLIGSGAWQTGLIVSLAIAVALLVAGRGGPLVGQAGGTAVLFATLAPHQRGLEAPHIFDALVGSVIGLLVVGLLLPVNPLRVLDRASEPIYAALSAQLGAVARALETRDADAAVRVLEELRGLDADIGRLNEALSGAEEVVTIAPARWHRRQQYHRYANGAAHLERLTLYVRSLARRSATALQYGEPVPAQLSRAVERLGVAVQDLRRECRAGDTDFPDSRRRVRESAELAGQAWAAGVRPYGDGLIIDLRTADSELLRATGCDPDDANRMVRRAAGVGEASAHPPARARLDRPRRPAPRRRSRPGRRPPAGHRPRSGPPPAGSG